MASMREVFFSAPENSSVEMLESFGTGFAEWQRGVNWWIGDLALYAEAMMGDGYTQVFPEWISPGLVDRCKAVSRAYPNESDRNPLATWSIHMQNAKHTDRVERVNATVEAGLTTDESRKAIQGDRKQKWILCIDVNYFLHRFWFSGAGVESAVSVASWVQRTVERLKEKGLTDVACCFDSTHNHRKALTAEWPDKYKDRPTKEPELVQQLQLVCELLNGHGFACVSQDGMEADDIMASYANQFKGRVTLMSQDKDVRQCLSEKTNILLDVEWVQDETSGAHLPDYKWLTAKSHTETTGIPPNRWTEYQCIMGDTVDGVKGVAGVGEKGAADLVKEFGTVEAAIQAAKAEDERIKPAKRKSLIEFETKLEVTRKLVTLRTDLAVPENTRI